MHSIRRGAAALLCAVAIAGCNPAYVAGRTVNSSGETLPGVTVSVVGTETEVLTGILGNYRLRSSPGAVELAFAKSGYAPARIELDCPAVGEVQAEPVTLWQLPANAGVFLYDGGHYREMTRETPVSFALATAEKVHAVQRPPRLVTDAISPFIVCYKTPRHDVRLSRLGPADASLGNNPASLTPVWIAVGTMGAMLRPVDEPGEMLLRLDLDRPLDPGIYAVHWGAMDGRTTLDERAFLFEVSGPPAVVEPIEPEETPKKSE